MAKVSVLSLHKDTSGPAWLADVAIGPPPGAEGSIERATLPAAALTRIVGIPIETGDVYEITGSRVGNMHQIDDPDDD